MATGEEFEALTDFIPFISTTVASTIKFSVLFTILSLSLVPTLVTFGAVSSTVIVVLAPLAGPFVLPASSLDPNSTVQIPSLLQPMLEGVVFACQTPPDSFILTVFPPLSPVTVTEMTLVVASETVTLIYNGVLF